MKKHVFCGIAVSVLCLLCFPVSLSRGSDGNILNLDGFYAQLDEYLKGYYDPAYLDQYDPHDIRGHFSYQRGGSEDLYGSADMVYVLYTLDELDSRTTPEGRNEWAAFIQSCQDPETGWFTIRNETLHFRAHSTAYAIAALKMLGQKPLYPLTGTRGITRSKEATEKWLESILWLYIWVGSHQGGGIASSLEMTGEAPDEWFDWYFGWLDEEVNPETGLWQRAPWNFFYTKPLMEEMGGAPHFWWVYRHKGRDLPYPEKIIDTILGLQLPNNLWNYKDRKGNYAGCLDVDAVWGILRAYLELNARGIEYRTKDISDSLDRYLNTACAILNQPDSLTRLYDDSHKLPGGLVAIAGAQRFFAETLQEPKLKTPNPWKQVLDTVSWL